MKTRKSLMTQRTAWIVVGLLSLSFLVVGISGCDGTTNLNSNQTTSQSSPTPCPKGESANDQLITASKAAGVNVHAEEAFTVSRGSETITTAPIAGWEKIPATDLAKGVDFAYGYFSSQEPRIAAGNYTLRATADVRAVGTVKGRVQFVDRGGKVAAEVPADIEVHSLTVPAEAASRRSFVTTTIVAERLNLWHRCPNGVCVRTPIFLPRDFPIPH